MCVYISISVVVSKRENRYYRIEGWEKREGSSTPSLLRTKTNIMCRFEGNNNIPLGLKQKVQLERNEGTIMSIWRIWRRSWIHSIYPNT